MQTKVGLQGDVSTLTKDLSLIAKVRVRARPLRWTPPGDRRGRLCRFQESEE